VMPVGNIDCSSECILVPSRPTQLQQTNKKTAGDQPSGFFCL
jgi:hypothetical protein